MASYRWVWPAIDRPRWSMLTRDQCQGSSPKGMEMLIKILKKSFKSLLWNPSFSSQADLCLLPPSAGDACISQSLVSNFYKLILSLFEATANPHPSSGTCKRSFPMLQFSALCKWRKLVIWRVTKLEITHVLDVRSICMTSRHNEQDHSLPMQRVLSLRIPTLIFLCKKTQSR